MQKFKMKAYASRTYHRVFEVEATDEDEAAMLLEEQILEDGINPGEWEETDEFNPAHWEAFHVYSEEKQPEPASIKKAGPILTQLALNLIK